MKIIVTGSQGYIGTPLCYELVNRGYEVIGIDNNSREEWVNRCGSKNRDNNHYISLDDSYYFIKGDLTNRDFVYEILAIHQPDCIIHLASQPSMPYSQINSERALFTQFNNIAMCVNLLWAIRELELNIRFIITTTTGIPGQYYKVIPEEPVINMAGSWYHTSRGFDSVNCNLASRQWGQKVIELRTSIVYGLQTKIMKDRDNSTTRFDTDPYFGTVLNRFIKQAMDKKPITIYGKGKQTKPFISLEDCVISIANAIKYPIQDNHMIFNQVTECINIENLAKLIAWAYPTKIKHIPNPRKEKESFTMKFKNDKFLRLLDRPPLNIKDEIKRMISLLEDIKYGKWEIPYQGNASAHTFYTKGMNI